MNDRIKLLAYRIFDPIKPAKVRTATDLTPQITKRAYELYERQGRHDGHANQDWQDENQFKEFPGATRSEGQSQKMADETETVLQIEEAV